MNGRPWSKEEVTLLTALAAKHPGNIDVLVQQFPYRSRSSIKSRLGYEERFQSTKAPRYIGVSKVRIITDPKKSGKIKCMSCHKLFTSWDVKKNRLCHTCKTGPGVDNPFENTAGYTVSGLKSTL